MHMPMLPPSRKSLDCRTHGSAQIIEKSFFVDEVDGPRTSTVVVRCQPADDRIQRLENQVLSEQGRQSAQPQAAFRKLGKMKQVILRELIQSLPTGQSVSSLVSCAQPSFHKTVVWPEFQDVIPEILCSPFWQDPRSVVWACLDLTADICWIEIILEIVRSVFDTQPMNATIKPRGRKAVRVRRRSWLSAKLDRRW